MTPSRCADGAVWCGIPVYNNAATIRDVAQRCREQIEKVVVVDDGSTDADLTDLLKPLDVVVIRHPTNLGKGAALLTALRYVAGQGAQYLVTLDGDGQHFPEDIPLLCSRLAPDTLLVGHRQSVIGDMPPSSHFGREFSDFWIFVETGTSVCDTQSGFRAYPVRHVLGLRFCSRHYNFEMEIVTRAIWAGLNVEHVPIRVWYPQRQHRVSSFRPFLDNLRISLLHSRLVARCLLPVPSRRITTSPRLTRRPTARLKGLFRQNATPLGLAAAAGAGILLGTVFPWPYCLILVLYVAICLHLNKVMTLATQLLCLPPLLPSICVAVGRLVLHGRVNDIRSPDPGTMLEWFLGAQIVGPLGALASTLIVYAIARRLQPAQELLESATDEHEP